MKPSLQHRLDCIWSMGAEVLANHHSALQQQLPKWQERLSGNPAPPWSQPRLHEQLTFVTEWFLKSIPTLTKTGRRNFEKAVRQLWPSRFSDEWSNHECMLLLSALENAVYETVNVTDTQQQQALQYWFFCLYQAALPTALLPAEPQDYWQQLLDWLPIPIYWAALLRKQQGGYVVQHLIFPSRQGKTGHFSNKAVGRWAKTAEELSICLQNTFIDTVQQANKTVITIPLKQETLLFATDSTADDCLKTFLLAAIRQYQQQKHALPQTDWKDALILFGQSLTRAKTLQETLERIAAGFVQYLPFERVALFAYSPADDSCIGMYGYQYNHQAVRKIKEHIPDIPLFQNRERNHQPIYVPDASSGFPFRYVKQFQLQSVVIAPLFLASDNMILGAAVLDQGEGKPFELASDTLTTLVKFSNFSAETLRKYWNNGRVFGNTVPNARLSPREIDALQLMADGLSLSEAADALSLSEFTVRDYLISAAKKLNAANRTQAVAIALRMGLIS